MTHYVIKFILKPNAKYPSGAHFIAIRCDGSTLISVKNERIRMAYLESHPDHGEFLGGIHSFLSEFPDDDCWSTTLIDKSDVRADAVILGEWWGEELQLTGSVPIRKKKTPQSELEGTGLNLPKSLDAKFEADKGKLDRFVKRVVKPLKLTVESLNTLLKYVYGEYRPQNSKLITHKDVCICIDAYLKDMVVR